MLRIGLGLGLAWCGGARRGRAGRGKGVNVRRVQGVVKTLPPAKPLSHWEKGPVADASNGAHLEVGCSPTITGLPDPTLYKSQPRRGFIKV